MRGNRMMAVWAGMGVGMAIGLAGAAAEPGKESGNELKVKREAVFEFAQPPVVTREGDRVTIAFESKGFCDATVTIEDAGGRIVRHLGSGVLGPNAPEPFQKDSKKQVVAWDGKDDRDVYVDDKNRCSVRVSLGLKPRFERNVLWSPYRRVGSQTPILTACDEGVLVFDGKGVDHVRLFDHEGSYRRTVYPFPAAQLDKVQGLRMHEFPQEGRRLPLKSGHVQATLLTSGQSSSGADIFGGGRAASAMVAHGNRILLAEQKLNRLALDGSSGGLPLEGPPVLFPIHLGTIHEFRGGDYTVGPRSMAISPDGKWVYLTSFFWSHPWHQGSLHGVARMAVDGTEPPRLWKGSLKQTVWRGDNPQVETGEAPADFIQPMSVACDASGRVYVADYFKDRIQVFAPDGAFVKSVPSKKPTRVCVDPRTGDIYVFSWAVSGIDWNHFKKADSASLTVPATLTHFGPVSDPVVKAVYPLPLWWRGQPYKDQKGGTTHMPDGWWNAAEIDFRAAEPTVWLIPADLSGGPERAAVKLYTMKAGKLELKRDTGVELTKALPLPVPAPFARQRMCVNPARGTLHLMEQDNGVDKNFRRVTEYNPENGKARLVELPCHAEDMCFDVDGLAYLRVDPGVIRFDSTSWREVPWDYGEERPRTMFSGTSGGRAVKGLGVLNVPGRRTNPWWHLGGLHVSARGNLAVTTYNGERAAGRALSGEKAKMDAQGGKPYTPTLYPGRFLWGEVHVFDRHGKLLFEDALPGAGQLNGLGIDRENNVYAMVGATRMLNGKKYDSSPGDVTETLVKVKPGRGKILSAGSRIPVPLAGGAKPARSPDVSGWCGAGGEAWVEGGEWVYGGVGAAFVNQPAPSCCCWNSRFALDMFGRSFAPEIRHTSVAVLDPAGNLILRVGRYGNADDGTPLVVEKNSGTPRSIGGDEVGLFYAPYVTTHTDRRLYIADPGNNRIVSVLLGYHVDARTALKDVPDGKK